MCKLQSHTWSRSKDQFQCHLSEDAVQFYSGFDCKYSDLGLITIMNVENLVCWW